MIMLPRQSSAIEFVPYLRESFQNGVRITSQSRDWLYVHENEVFRYHDHLTSTLYRT